MYTIKTARSPINKYLVSLAFIMLSSGMSSALLAQAEFTTWGNLTGIRVDDQLLKFESSICLVNSDWSKIRQTARERQQIRFSREGDKKIFSYKIDSLTAKQTIRSVGQGIAEIELEYTSRHDTTMAGAFFRIDLPGTYYTGATVKLQGQSNVVLNRKQPSDQRDLLNTITQSISIVSPKRQLEINFKEPIAVIVKGNQHDGNSNFQLYVTVLPGKMKKDETVKKTLTIKATGEIDKEKINLTLNPSEQGKPFDGLGGNFRLQNPVTDPPVIDYCLANLRVSWARVEMPWRFWQADENTDPIAEAKAGKLHERVKAAMEMTQRLYKMGMPIIISDWSAPNWAIVGPFSFRQGPGGLRGNPLNPEKMDKIYKSIADYVIYLKDAYGVEVHSFSFNESDLGINVRQTPEEHAQFIKGLGKYLADRGLPTKLLLGDTADVNGWPFTVPSQSDEATHPYISEVSFHSWRGYTDENLKRWADIAKKLNKPLLVGEGSIDAGAWRYPAIFEEPTYALDEIDLYIRILNICQPLSILQWQLTADYSPLSGGGVFGNKDEPLHPTQRFWNLKQLGATPQGLFALPVASDKTDVTTAALGDKAKGIYAFHLVNNGATREVIITGLPKEVKKFQVHVTDAKKNMATGNIVSVTKGQAKFTLDGASFTTLTTIP